MFKIGITRAARTSLLRSSARLGNNQPPILVKSLYNARPTIASVPFVRYNSSSTSDTAAQASEIKDTLISFDSTSELVQKVSDLTSDQLGYLNSIGMAQGWWPTDIIERLLEVTHVYTGLPWWGTIVAVAVGVRILLFPFYIKASGNVARTARVKPQLDEALANLKAAESPQEQYLAMQSRKKIMKENNISMTAQMAPILQLPLAYGFFQALRKMANYPVDGFSTGGIGWFEDLAAVDPYLGLQVIAAVVIVSVVRLGGETGAHQMAKPLKNIFTIIPLASIFITKNFSAAVVLYFAVNSIFSLIQSAILRNKYFKKWANIPDAPKPGAGAKQPESLSEYFNNFVESSKETTRKKARETDKKLEVTQRRKASAKDGFIKRH
ncbi:60Kd inner membrane protein-domain-containing protein [Scheffersomyces xylosifermentans]|uniref:60Kd inner membrane protein-domain-containing protein n=1 Tax=Scheffersomyces xylosifermentans TaxID=1304137 RepID=UPI00315D41AA